jgi:hypothetical protein
MRLELTLAGGGNASLIHDTGLIMLRSEFINAQWPVKSVSVDAQFINDSVRVEFLPANDVPTGHGTSLCFDKEDVDVIFDFIKKINDADILPSQSINKARSFGPGHPANKPWFCFDSEGFEYFTSEKEAGEWLGETVSWCQEDKDVGMICIGRITKLVWSLGEYQTKYNVKDI